MGLFHLRCILVFSSGDVDGGEDACPTERGQPAVPTLRRMDGRKMQEWFLYPNSSVRKYHLFESRATMCPDLEDTYVGGRDGVPTMVKIRHAISD